jgi:hypothetical protein
MARLPDRPGTYRIKRQPSGAWLLSGVTTTGRRMRIPGMSYADAEKTAREVFGDAQPLGENPERVITPITPERPARTYDWGLPAVSVDQAASVNSALGVQNANQAQADLKTAVPPPTQTTALVAVDLDKRAKRAKQAKSLMELAGISWAAGSVWAGRRLCENTGRVSVTPNPRQVNDLAEVSKETLVEWFGDTNIKPWQMMILLTIGIPLSMFIQSPKKQPAKAPDLKAVP